MGASSRTLPHDLCRQIENKLPKLEYSLYSGTDTPPTSFTNVQFISHKSSGMTLKIAYLGLTHSAKVNRFEVRDLFSILQNDNQVTSLLTSGGFIDDEGATIIADYLRTNTSLRVLDIHYNGITLNGLLTIIDALRSNDTLEFLNIRSNHLSNTVLKKIYNLLQSGDCILRHIELTQNNNLFPAAELDHDLLENITNHFASINEDPTEIRRNKIAKKIAALREMLAVGVVYQSDDPSQLYSAMDKSKRPYFDVADLATKITDLLQYITKLRMNSLLPPGEINNFLNDLLSIIILFHLRCVDIPNDNSTTHQLHPQVAAAIKLLSMMDEDSNGYKEACYHIGRYFLQRSCECYYELVDEQVRAFMQSALNFFQVCATDPTFKEIDVSSLIDQDSVIPFFSLNLVDQLLPLKKAIPDAIKVPAPSHYDEKAILVALSNTAKTALKIADHYKKRKKIVKEITQTNLLSPLYRELFLAKKLASEPASSVVTSASLFQKNKPTLQQIAMAIEAVIDVLTDKPVKGHFADHLFALKGTQANEILLQYISSDRITLGNKQIETMEELMEMEIKSRQQTCNL